MISEHSIQSAIMVAVSRHQCTVFRSNVGKVKTVDGRWFDTGLPKGHPDLYGFRWSDHLWGEAVVLYKEGFSFRLTKEQQKLIEDNRKSSMYIDETENQIERVLSTWDDDWIESSEIAHQLGEDNLVKNRSLAKKIKYVMDNRHDWKPGSKKVKGLAHRGYRKVATS